MLSQRILVCPRIPSWQFYRLLTTNFNCNNRRKWEILRLYLNTHYDSRSCSCCYSFRLRVAGMSTKRPRINNRATKFRQCLYALILLSFLWRDSSEQVRRTCTSSYLYFSYFLKRTTFITINYNIRKNKIITHV